MTVTTGQPGAASHTPTLGSVELTRNRPVTMDNEEIIGISKIDVVSGWAIMVE
jgi:hypothetical protein